MRIENGIAFLCVALLGGWFGCNTQQVDNTKETSASEPAKLVVDGPLRVLLLDDEPLGAILQREWRAISDHDIEITNSTEITFLQQIDAGTKRLDTDVVIFPSRLLGELVTRKWLRPTPRELTLEPEYRNGEIYESLVRRRETQWNRQPYAVSFGSPTLVMLRRTDFVPDAPQTWKELSTEVERLRRSLPAGVMPLAQPMADGWAVRMLLVRAAPYLYDDSKISTVFEFANMKPRITAIPFLRAAEELAESVVGCPLDLTPASALERFVNGSAAIAITWPSANALADAQTIEFPVAVSDLPGSREVYRGSEPNPHTVEGGEVSRVTVFGTDGRFGAVSRSAKNAGLANIFLAWATGPEQSGKLCPRSTHTAPFRLSHKSGAERWVSKPFADEFGTSYLEVEKRALSRSEAVQSPRLPGQVKYMDSLDAAVRSVVQGDRAADIALKTASDEWIAITKELDFERQKLAYRHSLGIKTD